MTTPILSIVTPAIWSRRGQAEKLAEKLQEQMQGLSPSAHVEHLVLFDNRSRSIGLKRQACLEVARGRYVAFVDDDDDVADNYVAALLDAIAQGQPDVITFEQRVIINDDEAQCSFGLNQPDEPFVPDTTFRRGPWHVCAWKRDLVKECVFPDHSYGEDLQWSLQARRRVRTAVHVPQVLHTYRHHAATTAAPPPVG